MFRGKKIIDKIEIMKGSIQIRDDFEKKVSREYMHNVFRIIDRILYIFEWGIEKYMDSN